MQSITIYNGMGEETLVVLGNILNRQSQSVGWDMATIKTAEGKMLYNQYVKSFSQADIAAE